MNRFLSGLLKIEHATLKVGAVILPAAEIAAVIAFPPAREYVQLIPHDYAAPLLHLATGAGEVMNPLEQMAIMMVMATIQSTVKNPAHKAAVEKQMLGIADEIYTAYGIPPAQHTDAGATASS